MIVRRMRYDIWMSMAIACALAWGAGKAAEFVIPASYEKYEEKHTVDDGEVGGLAVEDTFRAESVDDLLGHDTFTIVSKGIKYLNDGGGYYGRYYMHNVELKSGERVAAAIDTNSVQTTGQDIYTGDSILPVGRLVYEDLSENESFIEQIGHVYPLTRTDFYIDMVGTGGAANEENYGSNVKTVVQLVIGILTFPLIHAFGAKIGVFPYFFAPRKKKKSEWD